MHTLVPTTLGIVPAVTDWNSAEVSTSKLI